MIRFHIRIIQPLFTGLGCEFRTATNDDTVTDGESHGSKSLSTIRLSVGSAVLLEAAPALLQGTKKQQ